MKHSDLLQLIMITDVHVQIKQIFKVKRDSIGSSEIKKDGENHAPYNLFLNAPL